MITISLDEQGEFEREGGGAQFIAGLIFDDGEADGQRHVEESLERERIQAYYKRVIEDAGEGFVYPDDLHSNGDKRRDHNVVRLVKENVRRTLPEFLEKGTYMEQRLTDCRNQTIRDREGQYHVFVILKSDDGKKKLLEQGANMLARDDWAANRYFHMAGTVVNRIIFHNPLYAAGSMPSISLDIATRSTGSLDKTEAGLLAEFKKLGYRPSEGRDAGYQYFSIMDADIYRTLIAQEMVSSGKTRIKIEKLYVKPILYEAGMQKMEFLYLADSICSVLGYGLKGESADGWLVQICERADGMNPQQTSLVFGYDEIDNDFAAAWLAYENGKFLDALSIAYDAKRKQGAFAEHYGKVWFPYLEERIKGAVTPELFGKNVNELADMLTTNNLDQDKLVYLMQQYEEMVPKVADRYRSVDMRSVILYRLYDAGVSAFCHIGNAEKALAYYEKCREYAFYVGVDAYLRTNNKLVVCLEDCFEWDKALAVARENVSSQELASEMKREILKKGGESDFLDEAKAISQMARILAAKRDPEAEGVFQKALDKLERGSANYKITQSYLLHFYADLGMEAQFEDAATDYFDGRKTYAQRLKYIMNVDEKAHSVFSKDYALYVLIRGMFVFGQDAVDDVMWDKLCHLKETLAGRNGREPGGHPWEIIYKYLQMFAAKRRDEAAYVTFAQARERCLKHRGEIIIALELFGEAEIAGCVGDTVERDRITLELTQYLKDNFAALAQREFSEDGDERYQELDRCFTFMYK